MRVKRYGLILLFPLSLFAAESIVPSVHVAAKKTSFSMSGGLSTTISRQQIAKQGGLLTQSLQGAGVQLHDTTGNGSQVSLSLRGFGSNASSNTLLLVNGIPITNPDIAPINLNNIPAFAVQAIEVNAGSESVLYGDQAVGGVINILTADTPKKKMDLHCASGSYHKKQCLLVLGNRHQQGDYYLSFSALHTDNYREQNDYDQNLLIGGGNYHFTKGNLQFNYQIADEKMQYPGALTAPQVFQNRQQASNHTNFFNDRNGIGYVQYEQPLSPDWQLITMASYRHMNGNGVLFLPFTQSRRSFFVKPLVKGIWHEALITGGIDGQQDEYQLNSLLGLTNDNQQKFGLFGLMQLPLNAKWSLNMGLRGAEQISQLQTVTENKNINRAFVSTLGAKFNYTPEVHFNFRRAGSFRFPKAEENASSSNNLPLKTQTGVAYEAGSEFTYDQAIFKINLYQLNLKNEITFDPTQTPTDPFGTNRNLPPTTRTGFSLSANRYLTPLLSIGGQYDHVNARFQSGINAGNRIPLVAQNIFNAHLNYDMNSYLSLYAETIYTGNQYAANDDANVSGIMGGYTIYNFNLRFLYQKLEGILHINNVFNKKYYFYVVYQMNSQFFYPAPERNFLLTLSYSFL